jgi:hypothetical protein
MPNAMLSGAPLAARPLELQLTCDKPSVCRYALHNPFKHNDPKYAPVGNYMFSALDEWVERSA